MAVTIPNAIPMPDLSGQYAFVQDINAMGDRIQEVFELRGNAYKGTMADRIATPPEDLSEGTLWTDTDGERLLWQWSNDEWTAPKTMRDTGWLPVTGLAPGYTNNGARVRVVDGVLYGIGNIAINTGSIPGGSVKICNLPASIPAVSLLTNVAPVWKNNVSTIGVSWLAPNKEFFVSTSNNGATGIDLNSLSGIFLG